MKHFALKSGEERQSHQQTSLLYSSIDFIPFHMLDERCVYILGPVDSIFVFDKALIIDSRARQLGKVSPGKSVLDYLELKQCAHLRLQPSFCLMQLIASRFGGVYLSQCTS